MNPAHRAQYNRPPGAHTPKASTISVVIPVYNEDDGLRVSLEALADAGEWREVVIVDASDTQAHRDRIDSIVADCKLRSCPLMVCRETRRGRAEQMNNGAALAHGDVLLFLHADTCLCPGSGQLIQDSIARGFGWGWFDVVLDDDTGILWWVSRLMNRRARMTRIATGDQSIFVAGKTFHAIDGYRRLELMEDVDLCKRLKKTGPPAPLALRSVTSARRWNRDGRLQTVLRMWSIRLQFWCGVSAAKLARQYAAPAK